MAAMLLLNASESTLMRDVLHWLVVVYRNIGLAQHHETGTAEFLEAVPVF